ncbi:MAG: thioredoxin domain-containing protein [Cyanothece sp. SIO1E1]|nr:thioredoxin domain-containing protein [Cyanothece sp. SIO1E1]
MTNRLAQSQSLYLRKHAENPIDWWPWCDQALETAQRENKPIFLSIGYSSCHWCTVMEGEAFSDEAIAQYMNAQFLPIKVDREERPDVDSIYMQALQMMTGQGGWPLNVFLSPVDQVPFYGGTYFPVEPRYGRPGFLQVLQTIRGLYDREGEKLESVKSQILNHLQQSMLLSAGPALNQGLLQTGLDYSAGVLSSGGYGPSFPMIPYASAALRGARFAFEAKYDAQAVSTRRGLDLALGGIYDHVAGGFHRYTVDPTWTVPHFEKMLYDNGQIMEYLADLWSSGVQEPAFERAIAGTVQWLKREMTAPEGYFYAAQDADSFTTPMAAEPEEGAFYVWDHDQLSKLLTEAELTELTEQFTVTAKGNFEGHNVLQRLHPGKLGDALETALSQLFTVRYGSSPEATTTFPPARNNQAAKTYPWPGRIPSVTDTKMIVAWNSLMISGLAQAYAVFRQPDYWQLATQAANFILAQQWVDGRCHRLNYEGKPAVSAQSEDYALLIKALLDLHQASLVEPASPSSLEPTHWLESALKVQQEFDDRLWSLELGGYYNTAHDDSDSLLVRERSYDDNATPAANGVAIANLVRLALLSEDLTHLARAEQALQAFGSVIEKAPQSCPSLLAALDWYRHHTLIRTTTDQIPDLTQQYLPTSVYSISSDLPDGAIGLVCQGLTCKAPAQSQEQLWQQIKQNQVRD